MYAIMISVSCGNYHGGVCMLVTCANELSKGRPQEHKLWQPLTSGSNAVKVHESWGVTREKFFFQFSGSQGWSHEEIKV